MCGDGYGPVIVKNPGYRIFRRIGARVVDAPNEGRTLIDEMLEDVA